MAIAAVEAHRWSRDEYEQLAASGLFPPEHRMELIDGVIYDMAAKNSLHATGYRLVQESLRPVFPPGSGFEIRGQLPLDLGDDSKSLAPRGGELRRTGVLPVGPGDRDADAVAGREQP